MSKRITEERLKRYGKTLAITGIPIGILLFSLLFNLNVVELKGNYTANELCGGDKLCYLEMNELCFNEDVFVYPMKGHELVNAQPSDTINELKLYRGWGNGWREIPLNDTCTGSWCGCGWCTTSNKAKFSYAFRKDRCYDIRLEIEKDENSTINWNINPSGTFFGKGDIVDLDTNTPNCLDCYTIYELSNPTSETLCSTPNVSFINQNNLVNYQLAKEYSYLSNKTKHNYSYYNQTIETCSVINESCNGTIVNDSMCCVNQTVQQTNVTSYNVTVNLTGWTDTEYQELCINPNETELLKVSGQIKPNTAVDNIICFADYCFPEI